MNLNTVLTLVVDFANSVAAFLSIGSNAIACFQPLSGNNRATVKHLVDFDVATLPAAFEIRDRARPLCACALALVMFLSSDFEAPSRMETLFGSLQTLEDFCIILRH